MLKKSLSLISTVVLCCSALHATAQRKFSFGIGANIAFYSYSKTWINNDEITIRSGRRVYNMFEYCILNPQLYLTYMDKWNLTASFSSINQGIRYNDFKKIPGRFVSYRNAVFLDFLLGYDFKHLLFKDMKTKSKIDIWGQLGVTYLPVFDEIRNYQDYIFYDPALEGTIHEGVRFFEGPILDNKVRPLVQGLFRYAVFKHWYLQSAVNYRYLEKDWQPVCLVFGLGYKL